jgi:urease accessory protein
MPRDAPLPTPPNHQRAHGRAELGVAAASGVGGSRLRHLYHAAPLRVLFPHADPGEPKLAAIANIGGGLAGGDSLDIAVAAGAGAALTVCGAAAEKVYRSLGETTRVATRLELGPGALLEWLPQEAILFDRARLDRRIAVAMAPDARLLAAEMLVLGRAAHGEVFRTGALSESWRLSRGGRLAWADALRLPEPDPGAILASPFGLDGANAMATLVLAAPGAGAHRAALRDLAAGGATLPAPDLLLARWLGEAGEVRRGLAAAIAHLRGAALGLPARLPRLWMM